MSKSVVCLYIECSEETMTARMQKRRGESATVREDDNDETLKKVRRPPLPAHHGPVALC